MGKSAALISHFSKILQIIIWNRMKFLVEQELSDCQAGYRKNRGATEMRFVLQNIIEKVRNTELDIFEAFIDYSKAIDSVDHHQLFDDMPELSFSKYLVKLISSFYNDMKASIR